MQKNPLLNIFISILIRLPVVISAGFALLHIFVNHVPRIEINVEVHRRSNNNTLFIFQLPSLCTL
jgi:hypothetical protein